MTSLIDELLNLPVDPSDTLLIMIRTAIEGPNPEWKDPHIKAFRNIVQVGVRLIVLALPTTSDFLIRPQAPSACKYLPPSFLLPSSTPPSSLVTLPSPKSPLRTPSVKSRLISLHTKHSSMPFAATKPLFSPWAIYPTWARTLGSSPTQLSMPESSA